MSDSAAGAFLYRFQLPLERRALEAAVDLAGVDTGERVLDVATGPAAVLHEVACRGPRPVQAVGVDSSTAMLEASGRLPDGYRLLRADARSLPFGDASFDVVFVVFLLHLLDGPQRTQVATEVHRVLRPGGRVVTVTVHHPRPGLRRLLAAMPPVAGLTPVDPQPDLVVAGLRVTARERVRRGYPSLVLRAERP